MNQAMQKYSIFLMIPFAELFRTSGKVSTENNMTACIMTNILNEVTTFANLQIYGEIVVYIQSVSQYRSGSNQEHN